MKTSPAFFCLRHRFAGCLAVLFLYLLLPRGDAAPPAMPPAYGTNEDFSAVSQAVVTLLQTRDPARFAADLAPKFEDWHAILSTNLPATGEDPLKGFQNSVPRQRQHLESSAQAFLARAEALHLDFSHGDWHARIVPPKYLGSTHYPSLQAENETVRWAQQVEIVLPPESVTNHSAEGDFKIVIRGLMKFPGGWRCMEGVQWEAFPAGVADEKTAREIALLDKVAAFKGFSSQDDPALLKLGGVLVRFLRDGDLTMYEKDALVNSDLVWAQFQKRGQQGASRLEVDEHMKTVQHEQAAIARAVLKQMEDAGVNLKSADIQIKDAALGRAQSQGGAGTLDGLMGEQFKLTLTVKTDGKAKNGTPLSGDYILAANTLTRFGDDWRIQNGLRWYQLPAGVVDETAIAAMKLEDYIAENRALPPGTAAPEITFITLDGEKKMKLSDLRGKVVVLDFWATWCGPCQEPMAKLQTLRQEHPDWQDRVAIVPLSIDDTLKEVRNHVDKRGWTNTFNAWAGDGGWHAAPATTFRVTGVPTTYIIDGQGKIVRAGHPDAMQIDRDVDALLKMTRQ